MTGKEAEHQRYIAKSKFLANSSKLREKLSAYRTSYKDLLIEQGRGLVLREINKGKLSEPEEDQAKRLFVKA